MYDNVMIVCYYLREGGYVIVAVCLSLLAILRKNFRTDLHEILREGWQWANEQTIKCWWRSGSRIRIRIAALVRHALAEVCTVPVLLVIDEIHRVYGTVRGPSSAGSSRGSASLTYNEYLPMYFGADTLHV